MITKYKIVYIVCCLFLFAPVISYAARLYLSPASGEYNIGKNITLGVFADTSGTPVNASSGILSFPVDMFEVVSISKNNSIFSLWVQEPVFSNTAGTVQFEGVILNPGFSGTSGRLATVTLRPKKIGTGQVSFVSGGLLANDGLGTNLATSLSSANITVIPAVSQVVPESISTLTALQVSSPTHPIEDAWYNSNEVLFRWDVPSSVTEIKTVIGRNESSAPRVSFNPPISERRVTDLGEGTYYFGVQYVTASDVSPVSRFRVNIDTVAPDTFTIDNAGLSEVGNPKISVRANDETSGIDFYRVRIGNQEPLDIYQQELVDFELVSYESGEQEVSVEVFDRAGNSTLVQTSLIFEISEPLVVRPVIESIPETVEWRSYFLVQGLATPNQDVRVVVSRQLENVFVFESQVEADGSFSFVVPTRFMTGFHAVFVEYVDETVDPLYRKSLSALIDVTPSKIVQTALTVVEYFVSGLIILVVLMAFIKILLYFIADIRGTHRFLRDKNEY